MRSTKSLKRVLIMAGGTGGHVFPGLAVANYLQTKGVEVHWLGTQQGLEARLVPEANIPLHFISINGVRGKSIKTLLTAPLKISAAIKQSLRVIKKVNPDVVIGLGGFVSGPGGVASWLAKRPLVIHEQNAKAGMTNKILAHFAKRILEGFPGSFKSQSKLFYIGNPVRQEIENFPPPQKNHYYSNQRLLIIGGSLGAHALNEVLPRALALLKPQERPEILHQTGDKHFDAAKKTYAELGIDVGAEIKITPFIKDMAHAYAWSNMVLCRAGALTVAELCAAGLGSIFVPFPYAVDDHQTANADFMVKQHAAVCIPQSELTDSLLAETIKRFSEPQLRFAMAQAAYELRKMNVTKQFYEILCEVVNSNASHQ